MRFRAIRNYYSIVKHVNKSFYYSTINKALRVSELNIFQQTICEGLLKDRVLNRNIVPDKLCRVSPKKY